MAELFRQIRSWFERQASLDRVLLAVSTLFAVAAVAVILEGERVRSTNLNQLQELTEFVAQAGRFEALALTIENRALEYASRAAAATNSRERPIALQDECKAFRQAHQTLLNRTLARNGAFAWDSPEVFRRMDRLGYSLERLIAHAENITAGQSLTDKSLQELRQSRTQLITQKDAFIQFLELEGGRQQAESWNKLRQGRRILILAFVLTLFGFALPSARVFRRKARELEFRQWALDEAAIVAETDAAGRITYVNKKFCEISGYSSEELIGKTHSIVNSGLHPPKFFQHLYGTIRAGRVWRGELRNRAKDGSYYWVSTTIIPTVNVEGRVERYTAIRFDITDRKLAEEKEAAASQWKEAIIATSGFAIITTSPEGLILSFNPAAEQLLGYTAAETIDKLTPKSLHVGEEVLARAKEFSQELGMPIKPGFDVFTVKARMNLPNEYEWTLRRKDGSPVPVLLSVRALRNPSGEVSGYLGVFVDISMRKRAAEELQRARIAAEESARAKSEFLANMSHEIRTPLNGVLGMTALLANSGLEGEQLEFSETIASSAVALLSVVNDILDFSKIDAGKLEMEVIDFDLPATVEQAVELSAATAMKKSLELVCNLQRGLPERVGGDPGRLRQIILNLVSNAVKFTSRGQVEVRVEQLEQTPGQVFLKVSVTDTGIGISDSVRKKLFQPFSQVDGSITRRFGGTGLGLAICSRLVHLMDGEIGVESTPGQGSTFWFTARFESRPSLAPANIPGLAGTRVLIVDDNALNGELLAELMRGWEMKPVAVCTPKEGLLLFAEAHDRKEPFPVVLIDHIMPAMEGTALAAQMRQLAGGEETKILLMAPAQVRGKIRQASGATIHGFLTKPVRRQALRHCLASALSIPRPLPEPRTNTELSPEDWQSNSRIRILVAEDNLVNQKVMDRLLRRRGYVVDLVSNGRESLEALESTPYDLILMDCQMPEMDGFSASAEIRQWERDGRLKRRPPIIALTANAMSGDRERCLAAGMDDYLTKPVDLVALFSAIHRWSQAENGRPHEALTTPDGVE